MIFPAPDFQSAKAELYTGLDLFLAIIFIGFEVLVR